MAVEKKEEKMLVDKLKPKTEDEAAVTMSREMMEQVDVFQLAAEMLKEEGTEYTFCLMAGGTWPMEINSQKAGIPRVHVRHEQAAAFAADAWGRLTRRPGVVIVGSGTCMTNAASGITQGYAAGSPMVILAADNSMVSDDRYSGMCISHAEQQYAGITKWVRRVGNTQSFLFQLKRAFRSAVDHPTGPVCVATPGDMGGGVGASKRVTRITTQALYTPGYWAPREWKTLADPDLIKRSLAWLMEAEKPAMLIGHALHQDDAQEELREFVHLLGIPCIPRRIARGAISEYDTLNPGGRARGATMRNADRAMVMGLRIGSLEHGGQPPFWGAKTRYIQAQSCQEMVDFVLPTEFELIGNIRMMLRQYIECAKDMGIKGPPEKWNEWRKFIADTKADYERRTIERSEKMKGKTPLHPDLVGRLAAEFFTEEYNDDYISIIDGFTASSYFTDWNKARNSGSVLDAAETIGIGHGMGMAIGAGLATKREKPIFVLLGDGGLGAGGMDIETACRWNIPAIFFHENNHVMASGGWNLLLPNVANPTGNRLLDSWELTPNVRYDRMFAELGCHPEFVENDAQLKPALKRACDFAMREKKPAFIETFVDPDVLQEIWVGMAAGFSRYAKWDELPDEGKKAILDYGLVPRSALASVDPTWRQAILEAEKNKG